MALVRIAGAGLAGSAAAIAALQSGATARMWDPARVPKHRVCGEFLTPEIQPVLERLRLWDAFLQANPARMHRMRLTFGRRSAESRFSDPAFGLSRFRLDALLRTEAEQRGAQWIVERVPGQVDIVAHGRQTAASGHDRLFGFKAHFRGPVSDAVELYFFDGFYVGVNPVEDGLTNVCGLGSEAALKKMGFDYDSVIDTANPALAERVRPLSRAIDWLSTGPLVFQTQLAAPPPNELLTGDALQFIDPFTGTGMAIALWSGSMAGQWAAEGRPPETYYKAIRAGIEGQFQRCEQLRAALERRWALLVAPLVPPALLFAFTRPKLESR